MQQRSQLDSNQGHCGGAVSIGAHSSRAPLWGNLALAVKECLWCHVWKVGIMNMLSTMAVYYQIMTIFCTNDIFGLSVTPKE